MLKKVKIVMNNLLDTYYDGIAKQIKPEFEFINNCIEHQGEKGTANEHILRNLIIKFLPKRFGIGSGIIIDQDGKQANQSDLIIYDTYFYPMILGLTSTHLFPVDIVYAAIEIKTTLDSKAANTSIENIQSIKMLNYIKEPFPYHGSSQNAALSIEYRTPTPPIGCVFGYRSKSKSFKTYQEWFINEENYNSINHNSFPELIVSLDQGIITKFNNEKYHCSPLPLCKEGKFVGTKNCPEIFKTLKGQYPEKQINYQGGDTFLIDEAKIFLTFLLKLNEMLNQKILSPKINFHKTYFKNRLKGYMEYLISNKPDGVD